MEKNILIEDKSNKCKLLNDFESIDYIEIMESMSWLNNKQKEQNKGAKAL